MIKYLISSFFVVLFSTKTLQAQLVNGSSQPNFQNPPINMETMLGNRGVMYQLSVYKKFQSSPKFGFFSITYGNAPWKKEMMPDIMTQGQLTYSLAKGLDISAGMQYTPIYEFRPVAGLIYSYASKNIVVILNPKIDIASDLATDGMALIEYKPAINEKLSFYSRIQGLYGLVPKSSQHNRSYIMLRAGISLKEFSFGPATNFDWYGPVKQNKNNIGFFVSALLF